MPLLGPLTGDRGIVMARPEQLRLTPGGPGTVRSVQYFGADTRYEVSVPGVGLVVVRSPGPPAHIVEEAATPTGGGGPVHGWAVAVDPAVTHPRSESPAVSRALG